MDPVRDPLEEKFKDIERKKLPTKQWIAFSQF